MIDSHLPFNLLHTTASSRNPNNLPKSPCSYTKSALPTSPLTHFHCDVTDNGYHVYFRRWVPRLRPHVVRSLCLMQTDCKSGIYFRHDKITSIPTAFFPTFHNLCIDAQKRSNGGKPEIPPDIHRYKGHRRTRPFQRS